MSYRHFFSITLILLSSFVYADGFCTRIRSNTFSYTWEKENQKQKNYLISGLGGSIIYKSAGFKKLSVSTALYYSHAFFDENRYPVSSLSKGKDLLNRFDFANTKNKNIAVLGEAYLDYKGIKNTKLIIGRQLVESFYTKSNDTKMIPNTFDGFVLQNSSLSSTAIKLAYLSAQKLRDHTQAHSVLMYGDTNSSSSLKPQWSQNDDSAMHRGLTYTALRQAGKPTNAPLITGDIHNKSIKNLKVDFSFYYVPELLAEVMAELNYKINFDRFSVTSGIRYIKQFDDGAGAVGGASYKTGLNATGYKNIKSLNSQMIALKVVLKMNDYKLNIGYSNIFDEADLITPWRGFPTAGYTRSMARYNWQADTKSYRIKLKNASFEASILHINADEKKGLYDKTYYYAGFTQKPRKSLECKLRFGYEDTMQAYADGLDSRVEFNYLF